MTFVTMLSGLMGLLILFMRLFPDTDFAHILHRQLVEEPIRLLSFVDRKHILYFVIVSLLIYGLGAAGMAGPPVLDLAVVAGWDIAVLVDAVIAMWTASMFARGRGFAAHIKVQMTRLLPRRNGRARRSRRSVTQHTKSASNDDDPDAAFLAFALAA